MIRSVHYVRKIFVEARNMQNGIQIMRLEYKKSINNKVINMTHNFSNQYKFGEILMNSIFEDSRNRNRISSTGTVEIYKIKFIYLFQSHFYFINFVFILF